MKVLTNVQGRGWFKEINHSPQEGEDNVSIDETGLFFTHAEASCIRLDYPPALERLPFFARYIATLGDDDCSFRGVLMWITGWGVWNALDEGIGYRLVESLNLASGQPMSFEIASGPRFPRGRISGIDRYAVAAHDFRLGHILSASMAVWS